MLSGLLLCSNDSFQWRRGRRGGGDQGTIIFPFLNFGLFENCRKIFFLSDSFRPKMQNLAPNTPICIEKFRDKIFILSIQIEFPFSAVGNFQCGCACVCVRQLQLPAPPAFLSNVASDKFCVIFVRIILLLRGWGLSLIQI